MAKAKKSTQCAGAKKTARTTKAKTTATKKRPSEKAMELAAKDRVAGKAEACPKCGKPLQVIDADHKNGKVVRGCPDCDGSPLETKRAKRKAETEKLVAAKQAEAKERKAQQAKAEKPKAEPKPKKAKAKMSGLDAAAKVLAEEGKPMNCQDIVKTAFESAPLGV